MHHALAPTRGAPSLSGQSQAIVSDGYGLQFVCHPANPESYDSASDWPLRRVGPSGFPFHTNVDGVVDRRDCSPSGASYHRPEQSDRKTLLRAIDLVTS